MNRPAPSAARRFTVAALLSLSVLGATACQVQPDQTAPATGAAAEALEQLRVRTAPEDGGMRYDRAGQFQSSPNTDWQPTQDGCDTRDYILARDLTEVDYVSGSTCNVAAGTLHDAYTMREVYQPFGPRGSVSEQMRPFTYVDIEHVVSLGDAWISGAGTWGAQGQQRRIDLANDPMNLLAASAQANISKSDSSFDVWPAQAPEGMFNEGYACDLAARQIFVKAKYELSVTVEEKRALEQTLGQCPGQQLPDQEGLWWNQPKPPLEDFATPDDAAPAASATSAAQAPSTASATGKDLADCTAVWDALGRAITTSDPGFSDSFDGDGDGLGCEKDPR